MAEDGKQDGEEAKASPDGKAEGEGAAADQTAKAEGEAEKEADREGEAEREAGDDAAMDAVEKDPEQKGESEAAGEAGEAAAMEVDEAGSEAGRGEAVMEAQKAEAGEGEAPEEARRRGASEEDGDMGPAGEAAEGAAAGEAADGQPAEEAGEGEAPEEARRGGAAEEDANMGPAGEAAEGAAAGEASDGQPAGEAAKEVVNGAAAAELGEGVATVEPREGEAVPEAGEGGAGEEVEAGAEAARAEEVEEGFEEPQEEEEDARDPEEPEADAPEDSRPRVECPVEVSAVDSTINVLPSCGGKVLLALSDGGFQYLLACARTTVGVRGGRYLYEVRIVESRNPLDPSAKSHSTTTPRQCCALGFTTAGSALILGDEAEGVGFDSAGYFISGTEFKKACQPFGTYHEAFGVLLNLDAATPSANTVSLFRNGVRMCRPQPIPENLLGKVLYPTVNFKNMTLHLNFGPTAFAPPPFRCLMLQEAAEEDIEVSTLQAPEEGKKEVLFPVGIPNEGTFDWLDGYLKEHGGYTELSSRAVLEWGLKSGLRRHSGHSRTCNDKPAMDFGIRDLDDGTINKMIKCMATVLQRNYVVMEVQKNLLASERKALLAQFDGEGFRKVAVVVMGEPPEEHKARTRELILADKRSRLAREARRKPPPPPPPSSRALGVEGVGAKENGNGKAADAEPHADGEKGAKDGEASAEAEASVELSEEELQQWFRKPSADDILPKELLRSFADFSLPVEEEGFDEVRFLWQSGEASAEYLRAWIHQQKLTQRVENLRPGAWFRERLAEWTRLLQDWRRRHAEWTSAKSRRSERKEQDKAPKARTAKEGAEEKEDGAAKEAAEEQEDEKMDTSPGKLGPFEVEDVFDIGDGEPLFAHFTWEDWILLSLRFELHLLVHAYKHDVNDPERTSFHLDHLTYYYDKYYRKPIVLKLFGVGTLPELLAIVKDTIEVTPKTPMLDPQLEEDTPLDNFIRLAEDHRRERQWRSDAGYEGAALKLQRPAPRGRGTGQQQHHSQRQQHPPREESRGYQSRSHPVAQYARDGAHSSRHAGSGYAGSGYAGSGYAAGGYAGSGYAGSGYGASVSGGSGYDGSRGTQPSRHETSAPTRRASGQSSRSRGRGPPPPAPHSSGSVSGQKRPYTPSSSGGYPQHKSSRTEPRTSSHGSAPATSRGSSGTPYGSSHGGSYRR